MSTYVLVHGAWHGSWCWNRIASLLQQAGHNAITLDLPGRAGDTKPHTQITLDDYVSKVTQVIRLQSEPVVLVGHSMGGGSISGAAEVCPERIRSLVYLTAVVPVNGLGGMPSFQSHDIANELMVPGGIEIDDVAGSLKLASAAMLQDLFYGQCSERDAALAYASVVPEPWPPAMQPVHLSAERFGRVPKTYIECLRDRAIPIALQRAFQSSASFDNVLSIETDHSPFFSTPKQLFDALIACQ